MYDRETISLWIHTTGRAVIGEYKGRFLRFLPNTVTTWKKWRTEHSQTLVLDIKKGKGPRFRLRQKPESGGLSVGEPDGALKFFPLPILNEKQLVNDELGGKKIVVVFRSDDWSFAAFERGNLNFTWQDGKMVDQSGRQWNPMTGTAGELALQPVPAVTWLTSAWKRFYPAGLIYAAEAK